MTSPGRKELRSFGLLFGGFLYGIFGLLLPLFAHGFSGLLAEPSLSPGWPWVAGLLVQSWAVIHPVSLRWLHLLWMKFADVAGWINTRIIMILLFYLMIVPIGLIMKVLGKDPMKRKIDLKVESYRLPSKRRDPDHMRKPY